MRSMLFGLYEGAAAVPAVQAALASPSLPEMLESLDAIGAKSPADREKLEVKRFLNRLLGLPLQEQVLGHASPHLGPAPRTHLLRTNHLSSLALPSGCAHLLL